MLVYRVIVSDQEGHEQDVTRVKRLQTYTFLKCVFPLFKLLKRVYGDDEYLACDDAHVCNDCVYDDGSEIE